MAARRAYGTGALRVRADSAGRESWYGQWRCEGRLVNRRLGSKRAAGTATGLTKTQAEAQLRRMIAEVRVTPAPGERLAIAELGGRYRRYLGQQGRKLATLTAVESSLRVHLEPFFGGKALDAITPDDVADLVSRLDADGLSPKSIRNHVGTLSAMFNYAMAPQRRLATRNPVLGAELPATARSTEIRFLELDEIEALIAGAQPGVYEAVDRALYLTAAMTGLRQGELIALRWRDVDWKASRIRVRQNYVLGEFGTPKSRRSARSVPMADRVAGELDRLFTAAGSPADDDLVFRDPLTGGPMLKPRLLRRFRRALAAAQLDTARRFHDLRHTFGTQMAAANVPMRTLQEWMGHADISTTQIYADYAPSPHEAALVEAVFGSNGKTAGPRVTVA